MDKFTEAYIVELEKAIKKARKAATAAQRCERAVFSILDTLGVDYDDIPTNAENADDLGQAISCYINCGEYNVDSLMEEIIASVKAKD